MIFIVTKLQKKSSNFTHKVSKFKYKKWKLIKFYRHILDGVLQALPNYILRNLERKPTGLL